MGHIELTVAVRKPTRNLHSVVQAIDVHKLSKVSFSTSSKETLAGRRIESSRGGGISQTPALHLQLPPSSPLRVLSVLFRGGRPGVRGIVTLGPEPFFFSLQICEFVQKDELSPAVTQVLWEQATEKVPCSPLERCSSVMLLGIMAR